MEDQRIADEVSAEYQRLKLAKYHEINLPAIIRRIIRRHYRNLSSCEFTQKVRTVATILGQRGISVRAAKARVQRRSLPWR